jgi:hypothetical protein
MDGLAALRVQLDGLARSMNGDGLVDDGRDTSHLHGGQKVLTGAFK